MALIRHSLVSAGLLVKSKAKENDPRKLEQRTKQIQYGKSIHMYSGGFVLRAAAGQNTIGYMNMTRYFTKCSQDGVECATTLPLMKLPHFPELTSILSPDPSLHASSRPVFMASELPGRALCCGLKLMHAADTANGNGTV